MTKLSNSLQSHIPNTRVSHFRQALLSSLLCVLSLSICTCGGGTGGTGGVELSGRIFNSEQQPLVQANLAVLGLQGSILGQAQSDSLGAFSIPGIDTSSGLLQISYEQEPQARTRLVLSENSAIATIALTQRAPGYFDSVLQADPEILQTSAVDIAGNIDARSAIVAPRNIPLVPSLEEELPSVLTVDYRDLNNVASFSTSLEVFDSRGSARTLRIFFFKSEASTVRARLYVDDAEVTTGSSTPDKPRFLAPEIEMHFDSAGQRDDSAASSPSDARYSIAWTGSTGESSIEVSLNAFTSHPQASMVLAIALR